MTKFVSVILTAVACGLLFNLLTSGVGLGFAVFFKVFWWLIKFMATVLIFILAVAFWEV